MNPKDHSAAIDALVRAGCVAAQDEVAELEQVAGDPDALRSMVERRCRGEPLAWITARTRFCGVEVAVDPGVYVPRWQSENLARTAAARLPPTGVGVDLCTGSGALALVLRRARPRSTVVGTELDPGAVRCARANGVTVYEGSLDEPVPSAVLGRVDVMAGVLPYVPTAALGLLPRDVRDHEPSMALDGGPSGLDLVSIAVTRSRSWLAGGGWLMLEVGSDQVPELGDMLDANGFGDVEVITDGDGDPRGACGRMRG